MCLGDFARVGDVTEHRCGLRRRARRGGISQVGDRVSRDRIARRRLAATRCGADRPRRRRGRCAGRLAVWLRWVGATRRGRACAALLRAAGTESALDEGEALHLERAPAHLARVRVRVRARARVRVRVRVRVRGRVRVRVTLTACAPRPRPWAPSPAVAPPPQAAAAHRRVGSVRSRRSRPARRPPPSHRRPARRPPGVARRPAGHCHSSAPPGRRQQSRRRRTVSARSRRCRPGGRPTGWGRGRSRGGCAAARAPRRPAAG